jgi:uncharacterized protein YdaU (DUF1376 family)
MQQPRPSPLRRAWTRTERSFVNRSNDRSTFVADRSTVVRDRSSYPYHGMHMARPWMPLYVSDYLSGTRHLSTLEHGAYMLLLMHYWSKGGLPDNDEQLARIAGLTRDEWSTTGSLLAEFFDEGWKHRRVDFEIAEAERRAAAGRTGGIASGRARRKKAVGL